MDKNRGKILLSKRSYCFYRPCSSSLPLSRLIIEHGESNTATVVFIIQFGFYIKSKLNIFNNKCGIFLKRMLNLGVRKCSRLAGQ